MADIRRARTRLGRDRLGRFGIEGTRLHERALRAGAPVETVLVGRDWAEREDPRVASLLAGLEGASCTIHVVPEPIVSELMEGRALGSIVGLVRAPPSTSLAALPSIGARRPQILLAAVDVEEPGNVGALVRTALAGGAAAFAGVGLSDPFHPKAVRTSMGALFRMPVLSFADGAALCEELRREGYQIVGTGSRGGRAPRDARFDPRRVALLVGSEPFGLAQEIHAASDLLLSIPMSDEVDSFSVNAAAAILLYEIGLSR